jgi:hypothetical protein
MVYNLENLRHSKFATCQILICIYLKWLKMCLIQNNS